MFLPFLRVLLGLALACIAAGLTLVAFVTTPAELAQLDPSQASEEMIGVGLLAAYTATHVAVFAVPFGFIAVLFGEWMGLRDWSFYVLTGVAIALAGFFAQYMGETGGLSILNPYALAAFMAAGAAGGLVYWLCAGRYAAAGRVVEAGNGPAYRNDPDRATEHKRASEITNVEVREAGSKT